MNRLRPLTLPYLALRRPFLLLLGIAFVALLLGGGFAAGGGAQLENSARAPIRLGIASGQQDETLELFLSRFTEQADVFPNVRLIPVATAEAAREQVRDGTLSAALLLPDNLFAWVNGRGGGNPLLVVNHLSSLEYAAFQTIGNSYLRMLTVAQRGVSLALQAYAIEKPAHISYDFAWMGVNLAYLNLAVDQMTRFDDQLVTGPQSLSYIAHSLLCICFAFCLLLTPLLHERLSIRKKEHWIRRLGSIGHSPWQNAVGELIICTLGFVLLLVLLSGGLSLLFLALGEAVFLTPVLLPAILLAAVFLAAFSFLGANLGSPVLGGSLSCLIALLSLICAGGLVPKVLLPTLLQRLSVLSPVLWLRDLFAAALCNPEGVWGAAALALLLCAAALLLGCYLLCRQYGRALS